jgi:hypothetical protein
MVIDCNNQEHDLYIRAIKSLDAGGKVAEHHKVPTCVQEVDMMKSTNHLIARCVHMIEYRSGQYEKLFGGEC